VSSRSPASIARLVGLLIIGVLLLAGIGLFGMEYSHEEGQKALEQSIASSTLLDEARTAQVTFKIQVQDWKNFLIRGHAPADHDKYVAQFASAEAGMDHSLDILKSSEMLPAEIRDEVSAIREEHTRLGEIYREAMKKFEPARPESTFEVDASVRGIDQKLTQRMDAVAQQILAGERARVDSLKKVFESRYAKLRTLVVVCAIGVLALLALVVLRARGNAR